MQKKIRWISLVAGCCSLFLLFAAMGDAPSEKLYTQLLEKYVHHDNVDYKNMRQDAAYERCIDAIESVDPDTISSANARLAFWINAYNAATLDLICDKYPLKSIKDVDCGDGHKTAAWDKDFVVIHNKRMTLNDMENKVIRPNFKEPRIHFALVCAAKSCPPLRTEAYRADVLDGQLNDQAKTFLQDTSKNLFDTQHRVAHLSEVFDWYRNDFGGTDESVLRFISWYLPDAVGNDLRTTPAGWHIVYKSYDWSLNGY
ncbi:MAG TPA: DUF547 domain-containing protein [Candidatus Kapabacteria bacterium]|nr:DUF547 domain-containing protein [Candidatus Kapabacteria bacterium]